MKLAPRTIRAFREADAPACRRLVRTCLGERSARSFARCRTDRNWVRYLVACRAGAVRGLLGVMVSGTLPDVYVVEKLAVHPDERRRGTARALLGAARRRFHPQALLVAAWEPAAEAYRRLGFRLVRPFVANADTVLMAWKEPA